MSITIVCLLATASAWATDKRNPNDMLVLVDRTVTQDQGAWVIDYRLRNTAKTGVVVTANEIAAKVEGWVSNSRVPSHAVPRWSVLTAPESHELAATTEIISAPDEAQRCRERLVLSVGEDNHDPTGSGINDENINKLRSSEVSNTLSSGSPSTLLFSLRPAAIVKIRLRLEHHHILYGEYDPLLAMRAVTLTLGASQVRDVVPLDHEQYVAQPKFTWTEPPEDRRDTRHAVSGPDSLHLEAHVPGHQYYRYPERPVRYNTKMRLRFWYLIAGGTEGDCKVKICQYKETPISWRQLSSGSFEQCLKSVGRWTKIERIIQTETEATTLTLEFKIVGETELGEMWIDDVSLEPVGSEGPGGP